MIFLNWICFFHQINKCRTTKVTSVQSIVSKCLDTGAPIYWLITVWLTLLWSRLTHHVASLRTEASIAICLNIVHWQCHPSQSHLKKGHFKPSKQYQRNGKKIHLIFKTVYLNGNTERKLCQYFGYSGKSKTIGRTIWFIWH